MPQRQPAAARGEEEQPDGCGPPAALGWVAGEAARLGIDPRRTVIAGDSAE